MSTHQQKKAFEQAVDHARDGRTEQFAKALSRMGADGGLDQGDQEALALATSVMIQQMSIQRLGAGRWRNLDPDDAAGLLQSLGGEQLLAVAGQLAEDDPQGPVAAVLSRRSLKAAALDTAAEPVRQWLGADRRKGPGTQV